jgi:tetratricopeptide (TPR) repeat protein
MIGALILLLSLQATPELRQRVEAGLKAKAAGDLDGAIREFTRVAELAPGLAAAHVNLGAAYFEKKDYKAAVAPLRRAIALNAELPGAHGMLGAALLALGYAEDSIAHLEKARSDDLLGVALLDAGRTREALDKLEAALASRPGDPDLLYYLAVAHGRLSKEAFERLRAAGAGSARMRQAMGEAMMAAGNREAAEKHLRAALAERGDLRGVHYALGELMLESGDYERAEAEFRAEAELAPGSAAAAYKLGLVLLNRGRLKEAAAELERAEKLRPGMPETLVELGKARSMAGDLTGAEACFLRALEVEKEGALAESAHFQLAEVYRKSGRAAEAARELRLFKELRGKRSK